MENVEKITSTQSQKLWSYDYSCLNSALLTFHYFLLNYFVTNVIYYNISFKTVWVSL